MTDPDEDDALTPVTRIDVVAVPTLLGPGRFGASEARR